MSITASLVVAIVEEDGSGTVDTVHAQCPGHARDQIRIALNNAKRDGLLRTTGGRGLTVYEPMPDLPDTPVRKSRLPRVASVFDLAGAMR